MSLFFHDWENETFCVKCSLNAGMRTKSAIADFYRSSVCIGHFPTDLSIFCGILSRHTFTHFCIGHFSTDLRIILSHFVAKDVCALLLKSLPGVFFPCRKSFFLSLFEPKSEWHSWSEYWERLFFQLPNHTPGFNFTTTDLSYIASLEPPPASLIIKEFLLCLFRHLVVLLGHISPPNVNLKYLCKVFTRVESKIFTPLLSVLACLSLCNFPPPNQPTCMIET